MVYDLHDTIAAIGTATGGSLRGMVRLSGPQMLACVQSCFHASSTDQQLSNITSPQVIPGSINLTEHSTTKLPCDLFLWPSTQSYTRQPTAELHTLGSPALLESVLHTVCQHGARPAEPGEFTLRAFLAGRLDLTQAEAVLGVIDAHSSDELDSALAQLAGGLSQPLAQLREHLLQLLAELEAGLDFVEEDIEFITADQLRTQLSAAQEIVATAAAQLTSRGQANDLPRVVLSGPPNAGKSSLFNVIAQRYAAAASDKQALVSSQSGTTRDFVTAVIKLKNISFELVDTAGIEAISQTHSIDQIAQEMTSQQRSQATLVVQCQEGRIDEYPDNKPSTDLQTPHEILAWTKCDLLPQPPATTTTQVACSSLDHKGIEELLSKISDQLAEDRNEAASPSLTAARCSDSLRHAEAALAQALQLVEHHGGEELIAAEVRQALHAIGQVVGAVYTDDVLDRIFCQFCIGK